jgi:hypothetical protein
VTTITTLHVGHDVAYLTAGQHAGGCADAMSYYTATGEPPGQWAGKGAAALGLSGQVDPAVIGRLYQHNIGPGGELLVTPRQSPVVGEREQAAVAAYLAAHPYASATELAEVRAAGRGTDPHQVPYFDMTVDAVKSVSVLHASCRLAALRARDRGEQSQAAALDARADGIEAALLDAARGAVAWLERHATYTRTGHHSARTGEWRDGGGLVASVFLHHISRDGDPHLHVHIAIWNRVQRADRADGTWRTLDSRSLHNQRLAVAPVTDRIVQTRWGVAGTNGEAFARRVDTLYGTPDWRRIQLARDRDIISAEEYRDEMVNLQRWRLEQDLGYGMTARIPMRMPSGLPIYYMVFATDHPVGNKIMTDLYRKAAEREPLMRQEAKAKAKDKRSRDAGLDTLFDLPATSIPVESLAWDPTDSWDPATRSWWHQEPGFPA